MDIKQPGGFAAAQIPASIPPYKPFPQLISLRIREWLSHMCSHFSVEELENTSPLLINIVSHLENLECILTLSSSDKTETIS